MATPPDAPDLLPSLACHVPGALFQLRLHPDGHLSMPYASEGLRRTHEVEPDAVREDASAVFARLHPESAPGARSTLLESAATLGRWERDCRVVLPERGERWLHVRANPERLPDGGTLWHGFVSDVTERKDELAELRRRQVAFDTSITGLVVLDVPGHIEYVNRAALDMWGIPRADLVVGRHFAEFFADAAEAAELYDAVMAGGTAERTISARRMDGTRRRIQVRSARITGPDGQPIGIVASVLDITAVEAAAQDLRIRDEALASSQQAMAIADAEGRLVYANRAFALLAGHDDPDAVLGRHAIEFGDPQVTPGIIERLQREGAVRSEVHVTRQDGSKLPVLLTANVVRDPSGATRFMVASLSDLSESLQMQMRLQQSARLETVGRLAGGVAHDFNNLLTVMKGYLALAREQLAPDAPLAAELREVERAAESAAALTQRLLTFSRRQTVTPVVVDVQGALQDLAAMLRRVIGEDVRLVVAPGADGARVRFDASQFEQVIMNLAVNARDAMPDGGQLSIRTGFRDLAEGEAEALGLQAGPHVELVVRDTGVGMAPEVLERLFEPFFTTKAPGRGTGLGLAMVYGAVTQHGGAIRVDSAPGAGTSVAVLLPHAAEPAARRSSPAAGTSPSGHEHVWVVEDEPAIRTLTERILARNGYAVRAFAGGPDVLRALDEGATPPDLLVSDVIMPEMHGRALADAVVARHPATRVLFVSGYTEDVIGHHGMLGASVDFLAKPYSVAVLAQRVRAALDQPPLVTSP